MSLPFPLRYRTVVFYWLPVFAYCLLIFIQSSYPAPESLPAYPFSDKILHLTAYAVLSVLFFRAFGRAGILKRSLPVLMLLSIAASTAYGITDEIHQHYVPYRNADVFDALANAMGSVLGAVVYRLIFFRSADRSSGS